MFFFLPPIPGVCSGNSGAEPTRFRFKSGALPPAAAAAFVVVTGFVVVVTLVCSGLRCRV